MCWLILSLKKKSAKRSGLPLSSSIVVPTTNGRRSKLIMIDALNFEDGCDIFMRMPPEPDGTSQTQETLKKRKKQKASVKKEMYPGLYYEGKCPRRGTMGNGNYEVTGKTYLGGMMSVEEFWDTVAMMGVERYGLGPFTRVIGGGDGAHWIGPRFEESMNSLFILCRYHCLFPEDEAKALIGYLESNKKEETIMFFDTRLNACANDRSKTKKVKDLKNYLQMDHQCAGEEEVRTRAGCHLKRCDDK